MASYLERLNRIYELQREGIRNSINANNTYAPAITQAQTYSATPTVSGTQKNKGGIVGGVGYLGEKIGAGLVSSIEGIWDFAAGGIADLFGADKWAERQAANEWFGDWYETAGSWFNAGKGWSVAGDVAGGIGTSVPALAGALIAGPAGWAGLATTFGIAATSAGGTSLREAYDKTGKLTGKEWAYAGMSGATEGVLETVTDVLGVGIGGTVAKLGKVGGKSVAKTAAKNVAKQGIVRTAAINAGKSFAGEAFEEGMSAILNPQYAKLTYDPSAQNATLQEIAYSAFVGGMAGVVMGGGSTAYTEIKSRATANKLINDKTDGEVFTLAEALIKKDDSDPIGTSIMRDVRGAYQELKESLDSTNGEYTTGRQKYLLGRLNLLTTEATLNEATVASAIYAINNADSIAESLNALGYTDANGNKITYTADQIREGFKTEGLGKRRAVQTAIESNPILRMLSVTDAANRLLMDTSAFNDQTLSGRQIQSQKELNDYIEQASDATKSELGRALGIEDWSAANYTDVNKALASYLGDENNAKAVKKRIALKKEFEERRDARPLVVGRASAYAAKKDGIRRYKANGNEYAVAKEGDSYTLYDYKDKMVSNSLSLSELKAKLAEYDTKHGNAQETTKATEGVSEADTEQNKAQNGVKSSEEAVKEKTAPEKEAAENGNSYFEDFQKRFESWDGHTEGFSFVIGFAPDYLSSLEVEGRKIGKKQVRIDATKLKKIMRDHPEMSSEVVKKLPELLGDPILVLDSKTVKGRLVLLGEVYADGKPVMMALEINPSTKKGNSTYVNVIKIASAYTRTNTQNLINSSNIRYVSENKSRVDNWLKVNRLQLPLPNSQLNSATYSIPDSAEKSNTLSEKNSSSAKNPVVRSYDLAKTKVAKYEKLSANDQSMIRKIIRQGIALGVNEDVIVYAANIAARTHTDVVFNKDMCAVPTEDGLFIRGYANGAYIASEKRFYFNPEAQTTDGFIIHELDHAIRKRVGADGGVTTKIYKRAIDASGKDTYTEVAKRYGTYTDTLKGKFAPEKYKSKWEKPSETTEQKISRTEDEVEAFYAETALKDKDILKHLLAEKPTLKDRILNFFKGTVSDYASIPELDADARKYYKKYRKWFSEFEKAQTGTQINTRFDGDGGDARYSFVGRTSDGRGIYKSNYPENTPKSVKQNDVINLVQNVWSKKPIRLNLVSDGKETTIEAKFNPELTERSDLSKIAFGNRKGTASEKRITMNLSSDLYQIAEESHYVGSKTEIGKDNPAHNEVSEWHYFVTDLVYVEASGEQIDCYMNIDVKQNDEGHWFYSFAIEKGSRPADVLSVVTDESATTSDTIIPKTSTKINPSDEKSSEKVKKDSTGHDLSQEQAEYFKDSKVRDKDGNLRVMYQGAAEDFSVFDRKKSKPSNLYGRGFYFTDSVTNANLYGNLRAFYLNITNPLSTDKRTITRIQMRKFLNAVAENEDYGIENYGTSDVGEVLASVYSGKSDFAMIQDVNATCIGDLVAAVELFNEVNGTSYDGFILPTESVTFQSAQAKLISNKEPTLDPNISYSLPTDLDPNAPLLDENGKPIPYESYVDRGVPYARSPEMNVGQMRKSIANAMHYKVYSKKAMLDIVKQFPGADLLHAATRDKIADSMWQSFNSFKTTEEAESYIHDMARYILSVSMKEAKVQKPVSDDAQRRFEYMRAYVNGLMFTKSDLEDIRYAKGEDGYKRIIGRWGYKARKNGKEHKTPMDVFVTDIAREMPEFADFENMTPVDAFLALDEAYTEAKATVNDKWQSIYEDATDADLEDMLGAIEHELRVAFSEAGNVTTFRDRFENLLDHYKKKSSYWKAQYDNENRYQRLKKMIEDDAVKLREIKTHKFANATQFENDTLSASIGKLANVIYKGNLSVKKVRQAASDLLVLYRSKAFRENILECYDANQLGYYNEVIETYLETLAGDAELLSDMEGYLGVDEQFRENATKQGEKGLSKNELKMLEKVMSYFINFYKNYGKVWHRGQLVEAQPLAERFVGVAQGNKNVKELLLLRSVAGQWYKDTFLDPMSLMRMADGYERGFFTEMMEQAREAIIAAQFEEMTVMRKYDEFLEKNKKYLRNSSKDTVEIRGQKITKNKLIDLYCTTKRDQAWRGLAINGYNYLDTKGKTVRVDGELTAGVYHDEHEIYAAVMRLQGEIEQHLTALDLEYIEIIEEIYNVDSKRLKQDRDFARQGFSNVEEGYYYPIKRGNIASNIDKAQIKEELDRVSNASFNKYTVEKAAQELCIDSADARLRRHVRAVCQYAHLSPVIEEFNRMFNYDITGNRNHPISVASETKNTWTNARDYWQKMISDMQGINTKSEADGVLSYIRGGYAIAMLSMNPKVWLTQLSSFAAASGMLDASSIAGGGFVVSREDIQNIGKYCPLADLRKYENTAALAQGVLDRRGVKVGAGGRALDATRKFGEWGMKPIGAVDTFVINRLFGACMLQVEKNGGAKRGTEANKIAAGKLLTQLILETQQNSIATEKSAGMRSNSEFLRTVTMFSADAMKVIGRCVDGFGEVRVIKSRLKNEKMSAEVREQYTARLKNAKRKLRKALAALLVSAAYMAAITALFKTLYNKWDKERKEDESRAATVAKSVSVDFAGNMIGGLPLIRDVYTKLFEGYDVDNYAYSAINDVLNASKKMTSIFDPDATMEERASAIKSLVYSTSSFSGIPARNMYNAVYGITKRISEPTAYKIDEVFYKKNYKTDLEKYISQGDTKMADFMLDLLYDNGTTGLNDNTMKILRNLSELGYKVTPREVADSVTIDGEEYPISVAEQSVIEEKYFSNLKALDSLTSSDSYAKLTDEQRYHAVKSVLDVYYKKAVSDVMGTETTKSVLIASIIGAENMGIFTALVKDYEDDVDKKGERVSGTKRKKIVAAINAMPITTNQKILLMYAKGYTPKDGEIRGVSASNAKTRLLNTVVGAKDLSKEQKESLAKACGLTVKNGKIIA